jgi:GDPmannose 4,6-dehydratase
MPRSLILGVNGQDGSYLAEALCGRGHEVVGIGRAPVGLYCRPSAGFRYVQCDLRDPEALAAILAACDPDYAFHCAAVHGSAGFQYEPVGRDLLAVNTMALHVLLEHARTSRRNLRVLYAGSAKMFPAPLSGLIDESTPVRATCLYSISKIASREMLSYYRSKHNVDATNMVFFTHDSPRRPISYFLPKMAHAISRAKLDHNYKEHVATLDFRNDWSHAAEVMDIVADVAMVSGVPEVVIASGQSWHGRAAARHLFSCFGLDADRHLVERLASVDPGPEFKVGLELLETTIGRRPVKTIADIVGEMISVSK